MPPLSPEHAAAHPGERAAQLRHGLVEADVLEQLDPGEEHAHGDGRVELGLVEAELLEVSVLHTVWNGK